MLPWWVKPLAGIAVFALCAWGVHLYNESVRKPLQQQINLLEAQNKADAKRAAALMAERETANKIAVQNYIDYARSSDEIYTTEIARIRAAANVANGLRFSDPFGSRCVTGQARTDDPSPLEGTATSGQLSGQLTTFLLAEASRADEIAAYANSCFQFVNQK